MILLKPRVQESIVGLISCGASQNFVAAWLARYRCSSRLRPAFVVGKSWEQRNGQRKRAYGIETLEARHLLAAQPIISEFQASNDTTLLDGDGNSSDWVELYNAGDETINLAGWHLTDENGNPNKWQFPSVELTPQQYLVVFASGQETATYVDAEGSLHTDFKLSSNGEYLALVEPDGATIASEFAPQYPEQYVDVSYGLTNGRETEIVVDLEAPVTALVPTDGSLGTDWTAINFDDADWLSGTTGVGFEQLAAGTSERDELDAPLGTDWTVDIPTGSASSANIIASGRLRTAVPAGEDITADRGLAPLILQDLPEANADFEFVTRVSRVSGKGMSGILLYDSLTEHNAFSLVFNYESAFLTRVDVFAGTSLIKTKFEFNQTAVSLRVTRLKTPDSWEASYRLDDADEWSHLITVEEGGDSLGQIQPTQLGLVSRAPSSDFVSDFHYTELNTGDKQPLYGPLTGTAVSTAMSGINASIYTRLPFHVTGDPARFSEMDLSVAYDDGFVAYLNGTEIARRNAPAGATWNSQATETHGAVADQLSPEVIPVDAFVGQLRSGENLLAIHGLNVAADDRDFFLRPTLSTIDPSGAVSSGYFSSPSPGAENPDDVSWSGATRELVQFSQASRTFVDSFMLALSATAGDVFYTTDGTMPTTTEPNDTTLRYTQPIQIDRTTQVRARVIVAGEIPGPVASETFIQLASDVTDFSSTLPVMLIDNFGAGGIPNSGWNQTNTGIRQLPRQSASLMLLQPTAGNSQLTQAAALESRIGIRVRGAFSSSFSEPGYSVEAWGEGLDDDHDIRPLGLAAESDWVLYAPNPSFDRALIDNTFLFRLSNEMGHWAPDFRYVETFVNTDGGAISDRDHVGLYVIVEKVKRDPNRLDFEEFTLDGQSGGWMLDINRMDSISVDGQLPRNFHTAGPDGNLQTSRDLHDSSGTGDDIPRQYNAYINFDEPNGFAIRDEQRTAIEAWMQAMEDVLYGRTAVAWNHPVEGYAKYIDVDSFVDYFILSNLSKNGDAMLLSLWVYNPDPANGGKLTFGPIWDADLGSFEGAATSELMRRADRLWYERLFQDPNFLQRYIDRWQELRQDVLSDRHVGELINGFREEIGDAAAARDGVTNWSGRLESMEQWIVSRAAAIDNTFLAPPQFSRAGGIVASGTPVGIQTEAGATWYTTDGTDPRLPDGSISPSAVPVETDTRVLLEAPTPVSVLQPDAAVDAAIGNSWLTLDFVEGGAGEIWIQGTTGVGYDNATTYDPLLGVELGDEDDSVYLRMEFEVDDISELDFLKLGMQYDDGFVAYLNGVEVARVNAPGEIGAPPPFDAVATRAAEADVNAFEEFDISDHLEQLRIGRNLLAIHGMNVSRFSSDMLIRPELVGDKQRPSIVVSQTTQIVARAYDGSRWSGPNSAVFIVNAVPAAADSLAVTEINFHPPDPVAAELEVDASLVADDFEFVELANVANDPVLLQDVAFVDGFSFSFPRIEMPVGHRVVVVRNEAAFRLRYGDDAIILGEYDGRLNNGGERLTLMGYGDSLISSFEYDDSALWPASADGVGASLELRDPSPGSHQDMGKYYRWRGSTDFGGSPGRSGNPRPTVRITEVLANLQSESRSDTIELFNFGDQAVDMGGWYLSDAAGDLMKYRLPDGLRLQPAEYIVFDESDFNPSPDDPDTNSFALSGTFGDDVWLVTPDGSGGIDSFVDDVHFAPSAADESFGRSASVHGVMSPQSRLTVGCHNGNTRVGPVVITEVNYHPAPPSAVALAIDPSLDRSDLEYVEVHNSSTILVSLAGWRIGGGIDFDFPDMTLRAGETVLVLRFAPNEIINENRASAFRVHYGLDASASLLGGYSGSLSDSGERIVLQRHGEPVPGAADVPLLVEDEVIYDDQAPWPITADGSGDTLHRRAPTFDGTADSGWLSLVPSPGAVNFAHADPGDFNGDGLANASDVDRLYDAIRIGSTVSYFDVDKSGQVDHADANSYVDTVLRTLFGDASLDGVVDGSDFNRWNDHRFQACGVSWANGDFSGDGHADGTDFNIWLANMFRGVAATSKTATTRVPRAALAPAVKTAIDEEVRTVDSNDSAAPSSATSAIDFPKPQDLIPTNSSFQLRQPARPRWYIESGSRQVSQVSLEGRIVDFLFSATEEWSQDWQPGSV